MTDYYNLIYYEFNNINHKPVLIVFHGYHETRNSGEPQTSKLRLEELEEIIMSMRGPGGSMS